MAELYHYGVLGTKWGVRKDPKKAYNKASKKLSKLDKRSVQRTEKANGYEKQYIKQRYKLKARNPILFKDTINKLREKKLAKLDARYERMFAQSYMSRDRALKWYKKMQNTFKDIAIDDVDPAYKELGEAYAKLLMEEQHLRRGRV